MLQVSLVLVCLDRQQQLAQLHLTMVLLVLLLHQEALESQPQQTQQQLRLHQPQLAQLAVQLAHLAAVQVHHLRAAVPHHLVLVLLLAVAVVVVLLLVHQDPQVEDTMVAVTKKTKGVKILAENF